MALNAFKPDTQALRREWVVPTGTKSGDLVLHSVSGRVGVAITARGDSTFSQTLPDGSVLTAIANGGVGNEPTTAVCAVDGSWTYAVAGVTNGDSVTGSGTRDGTKVYRVAATGALTLTVGSAPVNTLVAHIDAGFIVGGVAPVLIGIV